MQGMLTGSLSLTAGFGAYMSSLLFERFSRIQCYQIVGIATIIICMVMFIRNIVTLLI